MDAPFLLVGESLRVAPGRRVLKAAEYAALADAGLMLDTARVSAQVSARRVADEAAEERRRGFREGADEARRELAATLTAISAGAARTLARIEPLLVEAVMAGLRSVLDEAPAAVFYDAALRKIARFVRDQRFLTLSVAPDDEAAAREQIEALRSQGVFVAFIDIQVDTALGPLSAVMRSESGTVDASLALQMEGLRAVFDKEAVRIAASIASARDGVHAGGAGNEQADDNEGCEEGQVSAERDDGRGVRLADPDTQYADHEVLRRQATAIHALDDE